MAHVDTAGTISRIKDEYSDTYDTMTWLTPEKAQAASRVRENLITRIFAHQGKGPEWRFARTKLVTHGMSPGCRLCGSGDWSCLFINGICNARCFYCPSTQNRKGLPMNASLEFKTPNDYVDYVRAFGIRAVSFSGGEPFMTFERVVQYLKALRAKVTALELMRYALENNIALPVNYCSFTFRHQFQRAGAFNRNALLVKASYQDITATGHIRTMGITGEKPAVLAAHNQLLLQAPLKERQPLKNSGGKCL